MAYIFQGKLPNCPHEARWAPLQIKSTFKIVEVPAIELVISWSVVGHDQRSGKKNIHFKINYYSSLSMYWEWQEVLFFSFSCIEFCEIIVNILPVRRNPFSFAAIHPLKTPDDLLLSANKPHLLIRLIMNK